MFKWFKSPEDKLRDETITTKVSVVALKKRAYHEIIPVESGGFMVRVYERATSLPLAEVFAANMKAAVQQALAILQQHNGD